jgi:hypothetical protein
MSKHNKNNLNEDGASSWACTASGWVDLDCCLTRESREPPDSLDGGYGLVWECLQPVTVGDPDSRLEWPFWTSAEVAIPSVHQVSPPRSDGVYSTSPRPFHATHPQILGICRDNDIITAAPPSPHLPLATTTPILLAVPILARILRLRVRPPHTRLGFALLPLQFDSLRDFVWKAVLWFPGVRFDVVWSIPAEMFGVGDCLVG